MNINEMKAVIENAIPTDLVRIESQDDVHFYATVVSEQFKGLNKMQQHRMIMALFTQQIASETIHAISLKTYTPEKWAAQQAAHPFS